MATSRPAVTLRLSTALREKVLRSGYRTVADLACIPPDELASELKLSPEQVQELVLQVHHPSSSSSAMLTANQAWEKEMRCAPITTSCGAIDSLFAGGRGIPLGKITEFCGLPGTGKTQIGMQLCINAQLPQTFGGTGGTSIYLDTEGSFVAKRVARIAEARSREFNQRAETAVTAESLMQGVQYCRVHSPVELIAMIRILHDIVRAHPKTKLIVVDSIAFLFRSNFSDMQMRTKLVATLGRQLASMAREFDIAVVVMNHMTTKIESSQAQKSPRNGDHPSDQVHPALGETWAVVCTHRIRLLSHTSGRSARLFKSPSIQERSVPFQIADDGISDLEDLSLVVPDGLTDEDIAFAARFQDRDAQAINDLQRIPFQRVDTRQHLTTFIIHQHRQESSAMPSSSMPAAMTSLTPSVLEVNIRRLMAKCDTKAHGADGILQGSDRTKYLANIQALKEMMVILEEDLSKSGKGDRSVFAEYATKIDTLASIVEHSASPASGKGLLQPRIIENDDEMDSRSAEASFLFRRSSSTHSHLGKSSQGSEQSLGGSAAPSTLTGESSGATTGRNHDNKGPNAESQTLTNNGLRISNSQDSTRDQAQIEAALQNDRAQREEMEAGLSILMQQLRHNAMAIHQTLADEKSSGLLDDADQALDSNITRLGKERTRLELYSKQSRKTKWIIWGIVLAVSLVFVFMFFIIRIF
ncbi:hypothetical protein KVV02_006721 [Mortierella alpina]|uniref:DNA repair protein RAD51 homolog 3 n=1 Tax=Mortierella alpina TaxID=64518 RepID=A0A9P7ZZL3_MORAP|nr:hypothetical protein KVV02_006721 [Mortierella alpina]